MIAEIVATGDEIRCGTLVDSNSAYIAQELEGLGVEVRRHHSVGDDEQILADVFREIGQRGDIAVVTGGLGPTVDDVTTAAAARAVGVDLELDPDSLSHIQNYFNGRGIPMPDSNRKQAMFPKGASPIPNPVGTAPGFTMILGKCRFFCLPGVPYEMKRMMIESVLPAIAEMGTDHREFRKIQTLTTFGFPESRVGESMKELELLFPGIRLGLRAKFPEIQVKLYGHDTDESRLNETISAATQWACEKLGRKVLSSDGLSMAETVARLLIKRQATIAVAESCTGGLVSHQLTNIAGSSAYFLCAAVTYANAAKVEMIGVKRETLDTHGAVHEQTAMEMAEGVRKVGNADFGLSTTGIAGPDGGSDEKPVGTICIGFASANETVGYRFRFSFSSRSMNKTMFAAKALDVLRRKLLGYPVQRGLK